MKVITITRGAILTPFLFHRRSIAITPSGTGSIPCFNTSRCNIPRMIERRIGLCGRWEDHSLESQDQDMTIKECEDKDEDRRGEEVRGEITEAAKFCSSKHRTSSIFAFSPRTPQQQVRPLLTGTVQPRTCWNTLNMFQEDDQESCLSYREQAVKDRTPIQPW